MRMMSNQDENASDQLENAQNECQEQIQALEQIERLIIVEMTACQARASSKKPTQTLQKVGTLTRLEQLVQHHQEHSQALQRARAHLDAISDQKFSSLPSFEEHQKMVKEKEDPASTSAKKPFPPSTRL